MDACWLLMLDVGAGAAGAGLGAGVGGEQHQVLLTRIMRMCPKKNWIIDRIFTFLGFLDLLLLE